MTNTLLLVGKRLSRNTLLSVTRLHLACMQYLQSVLNAAFALYDKDKVYAIYIPYQQTLSDTVLSNASGWSFGSQEVEILCLVRKYSDL